MYVINVSFQINTLGMGIQTLDLQKLDTSDERTCQVSKWSNCTSGQNRPNSCCIFRPAFGCCVHLKLVKIHNIRAVGDKIIDTFFSLYILNTGKHENTTLLNVCPWNCKWFNEASQDDRIGPCKITELVLLLLT